MCVCIHVCISHAHAHTHQVINQSLLSLPVSSASTDLSGKRNEKTEHALVTVAVLQKVQTPDCLDFRVKGASCIKPNELRRSCLIGLRDQRANISFSTGKLSLKSSDLWNAFHNASQHMSTVSGSLWGVISWWRLNHFFGPFLHWVKG